MILGFKKQFVDPYKSGRKKHTIRQDKTNRWRPGRSIQLATGVRTKNYHQFGDEVCISTQHVWIVSTENYKAISIDGIMRYAEQNANSFTLYPTFSIKEFAINDGFETVAEFWQFFNEKEFFGKIIHWTNLKY